MVNKIVSKNTVRLMSLIIAVLLVINVLPYGADNSLLAAAAETLENYEIVLVDAADGETVVQVSGIKVTMTLKERNENNDENDAEEDSDNNSAESLTVETEKGVAVFNNFAAVGNKYSATFDMNGVEACENIDEITDIEIDDLTVDGQLSSPRLLVPVTKKEIEYIVKVKNSTAYSGDDSDLNLRYWLTSDEESRLAERVSENDDIYRFKIRGLIGETYTVQAEGDPYNSEATTITIDDLTESKNEFDFEVTLKQFTVMFDKDKFENGYVTLYEEGETDEQLQSREHLDLEEYKQTLDYGESVSYMIWANDGYRITSTALNNVESPVLSEERKKIEINDIKQSTVISANFAKKAYKVDFNVSADGAVTLISNSEELENMGGSLQVRSDSETKSANLNETANFNIIAEANPNFHIESFTYKKAGDDESIVDVLKKENEGGKYDQNEPKSIETSIENVHSDYEITAEFVVDEFYVTANEDKNGSISFLNGSNKRSVVEYAGTETVTVTPKVGYHIDKIEMVRKDTELGTEEMYLSDEKIQDNGNGSYTFDICDITANVSVTVKYEQDSVVPMNMINITAPYKTENGNGNVRYIYRNDDSIDDIYISFDSVDYELRGITVSENDETFISYENTEYHIEKTQLVDSVRIYYDKQWHDVKLDNGKIHFILDKNSPKVNKDNSELKKKPNGKWTNADSVTISGQLDTENENSSKLDCVIWSREKTLDNEELHAIQLGRAAKIGGKVIGKTDIDSDKGTFSFTLRGQQEYRYYVYALDQAGNIFKYDNGIEVGIDNCDPTIYYFEVEQTDIDGNSVTFDEFGATAVSALKVNVTAEDINSGVQSVTLYGYDNNDLDSEPINLGTVTNNTSSLDFTAAFEIKGQKNISLFAVAKDRAGNEIFLKDAVAMTRDNSNSFNGNIIIAKPEFDVSVSGGAANDNVKYVDNENKEWYKNNDITINYSAEESLIGFSKVEVYIVNSKNVRTDIPGLSSEYNHKYNSEIKNSIFDTKDILNAVPQTVIKNQVNIKELCEANNIELGDGESSIHIVSYSRAHSGSEYISKEGVYKFNIDSNKPQIKNIIFTKMQNSIDSVLNVFSFGLFSNGDLQIDIEIDDGNISSGYNRVILYNGTEEISSTTSFIKDDDGKDWVQFKIPLDKSVSSTDKGLYYDGDISAKVFDNVTWESAKTKPKANATDNTRDNSDIDRVMIENVAPIISDFSIPEMYQNRNSSTYDGRLWYNKNIIMGVTVSDEHSGIGTVKAEINGTPIKGADNSDYLYNSDKPDVTEAELTFNESSLVNTGASGVVMNDDGSYTLRVNAVDNAGNKADEKTLTVYKDTHAPVISRFEFLTEGSSKNGDGVPNENVVLTEYGYYFKQDTEVRVYADDITATDDNAARCPSSGVNKIYFKAVDKDGNVIVNNSDDGLLTDANGTAVFTVPADFKGQILAYADDNVGNSTKRFVTPTGTIIETPEEHESENPHIVITMPQATAVTGSGNPLYAGPVDVNFAVTDFYSGIDNIEVTINNDSYNVYLDNIHNDDIADDWNIDEREYNLITKMSRTITVADNMNDIPITVKMTDRSGNVSVEQTSFSIDTTAPNIAIAWDQTPSDSSNSDFFNRQRTATVTVTDRNFSARNFVPEITKNNERIVPSISGWSSSGSGDSATHSTTITFASDGDYKFSAYCFDDVGNRSNTASTQPFTMDFTKPVISVTYDNNDVHNGMYYSKDRTATIEITEHNFDESRIQIKGKADDNGNEIEFPKASKWTTAGDKHTATISYTDDALYTFSISVRDKAGNESSSGSEDKFYIDRSEPVIEFSGVKNKSANNGDIAPIIRLSDNNYDESGVEISLVGANNKKVNYERTVENVSLGQVYTYKNFEFVKKVDDLYTLSVKLTDRAGNRTEAELKFSANRFGSVYTMDKSLEEILNKYINEEIDVIFTETNVDTISPSSVDMKVIKNGTPNDLRQNTEYTIEEAGGDGSWSQYKYTVKSSVFTEDGGYNVDVYSVDKAKNENENIAEDKNADIVFGIDKTEPVITAVNIEDGEQYNTTVKQAQFEIKDNIVLENAEIKLNGQTVNVENDGDSFNFDIPESNRKQSIVITAYDSAGNTNKLKFDDILVSTNVFVRLINNTPLFIGLIIGAAVILFGIIALIIALIRKKRSV